MSITVLLRLTVGPGSGVADPRPIDLDRGFIYLAVQVLQVSERRIFQVAESTSDGVFAISVAADLVSMPIQNLRVYESRGLVDPERTPGGTRRYSRDDLVRLERIRDLLVDGLNLAGVERVLLLEARVERLEDDNRRLRRRPKG
jgi:MerR family transcriptional regulator/heat shock protein HspR